MFFYFILFFVSAKTLILYFFIPFFFVILYFLVSFLFVPTYSTSNDPVKNQTKTRLHCSLPPLTAYPAMYGPMAHHYGNDVSALTPGSTEGSAHGKPIRQSPGILLTPILSLHSSFFSFFLKTKPGEK
jgi:hypothetical protein